MMELYIYPCLDSLLYFPVYLTIGIMSYDTSNRILDEKGKEKEPFLGIQDGACIWEYENLRINLQPPAGGDMAALEKLTLHKCSEDSIPVAVSDPMIAFDHNMKKNPYEVKIVATFIDRIAIWGVTFCPERKNTRRRRNISKLHYCHDRGLNPEPHDLEGCKITYCKSGFTTEYIINRLIDREGPITYNIIENFGIPEIEPIFDLSEDGSDLSFTNIPWLAEQIWKREHPELKGQTLTLYSFPAVPFPFSSVITTSSVIAKPKAQKALTKFLNYMLVAVALAYRYPKEVAEYFVSNRARFRNFGLPEELTFLETSILIEHAITNLTHQDFLSEQLLSSLAAWDFALGIKYEDYNLDTSPNFYTTWFETVKDQFVSQQTTATREFLEQKLRMLIFSFKKNKK